MSATAATQTGDDGWTVYIILADDQRLYTGVTNDLARRWRQHSEGSGAKFFRGRRPQAVVFVERGHDRGSALRREAAIKRMPRVAKLALIAASVAPDAENIAAQKQTADIP